MSSFGDNSRCAQDALHLVEAAGDCDIEVEADQGAAARPLYRSGALGLWE
jgi:hypothetical protein